MSTLLIVLLCPFLLGDGGRGYFSLARLMRSQDAHFTMLPDPILRSV